MRDRNEVQTELHGAERALEHDVAELKHYVDDAIAKPRHVIEVIEHAARRTASAYAWSRAHARPIAMVAGGAAVAGVAIWLVARRRR